MRTRAEAVAVARAFSQTRASYFWNENEVEVSADQIDGKLCWRVTTTQSVSVQTPWPEQPMNPATMTYLVGQDDGTCLGFEVGRSRTIFRP